MFKEELDESKEARDNQSQRRKKKESDKKDQAGPHNALLVETISRLASTATLSV